MSDVCYAYDPDTGEYLGLGATIESPMEPGVYLYPAHTTLKAPPTALVKQWPVLTNGKWLLVPDLRGETWYSDLGDPVVVDKIGDPLKFDPPLLKAPPPPTPISLTDYAKMARDKHEVGGITVGGVGIATDDRSKTLIQGARRRVELDPSAITMWASTDGKIYNLDPATLIAISNAVADHVAVTFNGYALVVNGIADFSIKTNEEIDAVFDGLNTKY